MTFDPYRTYDPHRNEPPRDLDESSGGTILLGAANPPARRHRRFHLSLCGPERPNIAKIRSIRPCADHAAVQIIPTCRRHRGRGRWSNCVSDEWKRGRAPGPQFMRQSLLFSCFISYLDSFRLA